MGRARPAARTGPDRTGPAGSGAGGGGGDGGGGTAPRMAAAAAAARANARTQEEKLTVALRPIRVTHPSHASESQRDARSIYKMLENSSCIAHPRHASASRIRVTHPSRASESRIRVAHASRASPSLLADGATLGAGETRRFCSNPDKAAGERRLGRGCRR